MSWADLGASHEIDVIVAAPGRPDVRTPIWVVAVGDELYVRSWKGEGGLWYRRALKHGAGTVVAGDERYAVRFTPAGEPGVNAQIDEAFRGKYGTSPYTEAMTEPPAAGTTLRLDRL
ncbi:DUF2255 family protein [Actinoplanes sp. RD1]|uniref:DUF2255 family protein n=1 Tax=Actinoplanes sp. RD1 TaxID=3064538 RepID=UPI0027416E1C|nr:DUF2255 family protein [Actinoplanes sp. RD1]